MSEASGASAALDLASGAKARKKKHQASAGAFPDLLALARNALGPKASSPERAKAPTRDAVERGAASLERAGARKSARTGAELVGAARSAAQAGPKARAEGSAAVATGDDAKARKKDEKKAHGQPEGLGPADQAAPKPAADSKRARDSAEAARSARAVEAGATRAPIASKPGDSAHAAPKPAAQAADEERKVEDRKREGAKNETKLSFLDLRRSPEARRAAAKREGPSEEEAPKEAVREVKGGVRGHEHARELTLDATAAKAGGTSGNPRGERPSPAGGQDFQAALAERMREAWNGEVVKSAHIVLRDGDAGTIRLRLRPESPKKK